MEDETLEAFTLPPDGEHEPMAIAARLVASCHEFEHLRHGNASVLFLMRTEPLDKQGQTQLGMLALPVFQGKIGPIANWLLSRLCDGAPDFIMVLDATWWEQAAPSAREALVFHELLHAAIALDREGEPRFTAEGNPVWAIRPHDIEEFNEVVARYGAWKSDINGFIAALRAGGAI